MAAALLLPELFLILQASRVGWPELHRVLLRPLSGELLRNTVELAVMVTAATAVIGTRDGLVIERTALPLKRMWAVLVVLPVSIPDFVVGYSWHSLSASFIGLFAAAFVMTLDLFPLVYLPVAAALRRTDPALEEAARALGKRPLAIFARVILPQIRPAMLGGCLVVMLALLAEFGAFEILSFRTFTTEIFTELQVDTGAASALSLLLVLLGIVVLVSEALAGGRGRISRSSSQAARPPGRGPPGLVARAGPARADRPGRHVGRRAGRHVGLLAHRVGPHDAAGQHHPAVGHPGHAPGMRRPRPRWRPRPRSRSRCSPRGAAAGSPGCSSAAPI